MPMIAKASAWWSVKRDPSGQGGLVFVPCFRRGGVITDGSQVRFNAIS
jgi:hypothetical protein